MGKTKTGERKKGMGVGKRENGKKGKSEKRRKQVGKRKKVRIIRQEMEEN